jgi:hypothetical protein
MSNILTRSIAPALSSALLAPPMLSVLRIVAGLAMLEHGTGKLLGFPAGLPFIDKMPTDLLYFTGTMELVGGALARRVHPPGGVHSVRLHGRRLFHGALPDELLSGAQLRRAGGALLLHFPLSRRGRPGAVGARQELTGSVGRCGVVTVRPVADRSRGLSGVLLQLRNPARASCGVQLRPIPRILRDCDE